MPKLNFLLEFLVIALDPPTELGESNVTLSGSVESQYLVGSMLSTWPEWRDGEPGTDI
jgi:hypothetical protein